MTCVFSFRRFAASALCALTVLSLCAVFAPSSRADGTKLLAITFDDGPSEHTAELLDGLAARGVPATFFMNGKNGGGKNGTANHADLLRRMVEDGHQLANHTYSHANFAKLSGEKMKSEVAAVEVDLFAAVGGAYLDLVRIPGGANTDAIRKNVAHPLIAWSVDPYDWRDRNEDTVYQRIVSAAKDGSVILLHDLYPTSIRGGLRAVDKLKADGYEFVTVSELFRRRGVYLQNGTVYRSAPSGGETLPAYRAPTVALSADEEGAAVVTITAENPYLELHYTTDGSLPSLASPLYTAPVALAEGTQLRAAGFDRFATRTPVAEATVSAPTALPRIDSWDGKMLTLACATADAEILYTTDGSDPRVWGKVYDGAFEARAVTRFFARSSSREESAERAATRTAGGGLFYDLPLSHRYYASIGTAAARGWMQGTAPYVFSPEAPTTRGALVSILYRMEGSPEVTFSSRFSDVTATTWCAAAVEWGAANGVVNGVDKTRFLPFAPLKREQAAALLYRFVSPEGADASVLDLFSDGGEVSAYAREAFAWCVENRLIEPVEGRTLAPAQTATRAQMAQMLAALDALPTGGAAD